MNPLLSHLNTAYALSACLSRIHVNTGLTQLGLIVVVVCHVGDLGCFLYMTSNWCIQVKSTQEWSAVVSCAWDFILLFPVMFHMVRTLHEFYFVLNWTPDNCWPVESDRSSDRLFLTGTVCFHHKVSAVMKESHPHSKGYNYSLEWPILNTDTLIEVFLCFLLSCKANAGV